MNNLTAGQLQQRAHYAISQLKKADQHFDKHYTADHVNRKRHLQNADKILNDCDGKMDTIITVRQIDQYQSREGNLPSNQTWQIYVDKLLAQGCSANEIQKLLREAADDSMDNNPERLREVFAYLNSKRKCQPTQKEISSIEFITKPLKTCPTNDRIFTRSSLFKSVKSYDTNKASSGIHSEIPIWVLIEEQSATIK